jgi:hypothetical protein
MEKQTSLLQKIVNYGPKKKYIIGHCGQCYKTFTSVILEFLLKARVFFPGKLFKPSLTKTLACYKSL